MLQKAIELQERFKNDRFEIIPRGKASESAVTVYGESPTSLRLSLSMRYADDVLQNGEFVVSIVQERFVLSLRRYRTRPLPADADPLQLYNVGPLESLDNFAVHFRNRLHRSAVDARLRRAA